MCPFNRILRFEIRYDTSLKSLVEKRFFLTAGRISKNTPFFEKWPQKFQGKNFKKKSFRGSFSHLHYIPDVIDTSKDQENSSNHYDDLVFGIFFEIQTFMWKLTTEVIQLQCFQWIVLKMTENLTYKSLTWPISRLFDVFQWFLVQKTFSCYKENIGQHLLNI